MQLLRTGVLAGTAVVVAAPGGDLGPLGDAVAARTAELGASVRTIEVDPAGDERPFAGPADVLVWDGAAAVAGGVRAALDGAWLAIRPVAAAAMLPEAVGGRIAMLAPPPGGVDAAGARAGLENLARTLSVEWARFMVRPVAVLPGAGTSPAQAAELVA